jgi:hypothetical protein
VKNIFVKSGNIINGNPENRNENKTKVKTVIEFNRNINSKSLGFNNGFPVNEEYNPANGGS